MKLSQFIKIILLSFALLSAPLYAASILQPATDTVNSGIINAKIVGKSQFSNVDATVNNGIAIFTGRVDSTAQVSQLENIAHSVSGVHGVNVSGLKVGK